MAEQALETLDRNRDLLPKIENAQLEEVLADQLATVSRFGSQIAPVFAEVSGEGRVSINYIEGSVHLGSPQLGNNWVFEGY